MKKLVSIACCLLMIVSLVGCGEKEGTVKVGVVQLAEHPALNAATEGFNDELKRLMPEVEIIEKNANGEISACSTIVDGFITKKVDLIMANATPALQAASAKTESIPILGTSVTEYGVALGIEDFNGVTGFNVSGTTDLAPLEQQAQMILDLIPNVKTVGILYCSNEDNSKYQVKIVSEYLQSKNIKVETKSFTDSTDIKSTTEKLCGMVDAIYVPTDNKAADNGEAINDVCFERKIPVISGEEGTCKTCGLATLTIDYYELGKVTANMAYRILTGQEKVEEMKIENYPNPVKKYNKTNAENLGITIPSDYIEVELEEE